MATMISSVSHYHWVKSIAASTFGNGALKLTLQGAEDENLMQFNTAEITVFMDDVELVERLIKAINGAAKAEAEQSEAA